MIHHHMLILAVIGLSAVIWFIARWRQRRPDPVLAEDRAAPYREGLRAASRIQAAALDLEQQLYAEAARRAEADAGREP